MNICLIDDEKPILKVLTRILIKKGFDITAFSDSKDAVDFLLKEGSEMDIVISDFNIEPFSAFEIYKKVNNTLKLGVKFIIMSGCEPDNIPENINFLQKPFVCEELFNLIIN